MTVGRRGTSLLLAALACIAAFVLGAPSAASGAPVDVEEGALTWGMKTSFRAYAGLGVRSDEVSVNGKGEYVFPLTSGSYDAETTVTKLAFAGSVHWQLHYYPDEAAFIPVPPGYTGPLDIYVLDLKFEDPQVTIGPDGSTLTAEVVSRDANWALTDHGRVELTTLDPTGIAPDVAGGATTWSGIPSSVTAFAAKDIFNGQYPIGTAFDPVGIAYEGPGGAPDFSENLSEPGAPRIERTAHTTLFGGSGSGAWAPWWVDPAAGVIHAQIREGAKANQLQAFDTAAMQPLGSPTDATGWIGAAVTAPIIDTADRRAYMSLGGGAIDAYAEWDPSTSSYVTGTLGQPLNVRGHTGVLWDPARQRGYSFELEAPDGVDPTDWEQHVWYLNVYTETAPGVFDEERIELPHAPKGWNGDWYSAWASDSAVASDGSLILPPLAWLTPMGDDPADVDPPIARRVVVENGTATITEIPGTGGSEFALRAIAGGNGHAALVRESSDQAPAAVLPLEVGAGGAVAGDWISLPEGVNGRAFAIDPSDGTIWAQGMNDKQLVMIRGGAIAGTIFDNLLNVRAAFLWVDAAHNVYALASDGEPFSADVPYTYAIARYAITGYAPIVATQPQPQAVVLGVGESTEDVSFSSTGDAPRQWQAKAPGASRFADIAGETAETLTVAAAPGMDGTEYRALYENAAGRVASDVATLAVDYAPIVKTDVFDRTVAETADAQFSVQPDGHPEPDVTWQRRVGGFWATIAVDDDDFVIDGSTLTVVDTNADQSGSLFRARLSNSVATVFSRAAALTVRPKAKLPEGVLENVTLDWTGNAELQKAPPFGGSNFFSAGASDGGEGTYAARAGDTVVYQVSAAGAETVASWATRAGHVLNGGRQVVRLYGGTATTDATGSTTVRWDGAFSVNFYGGLVPFTLGDLQLTVDAGGSGRLTADLSGYASSMLDPGQRTPIPPVQDVTVATFSGVELTPDGRIEVTPDYAGVEVVVPAPTMPQNRATAGWGAWPQAFVDFHVQTGLASYWYSSGGTADQAKPPHPFMVDLSGATPPPMSPPPLPPVPVPDPPPGPDPAPKPASRPGAVAALKRTQTIGAKRGARVAVLSCAAGGTCRVRAPKQGRLKIAGKRYAFSVLAPRSIAGGGEAPLRVRLSKKAAARLAGRTAVVKFEVTITSGGRAVTRTVRVTIRGPSRH